MKLRDYQKKLLKSIYDNRYTICLSPRQSGKCVIGETLVTVRQKSTGEIKTLPVSELYQQQALPENRVELT